MNHYFLIVFFVFFFFKENSFAPGNDEDAWLCHSRVGGGVLGGGTGLSHGGGEGVAEGSGLSAEVPGGW